MTFPDFLFPAFAVLLGYVVLGITGFGSALVIVPLLTWRWPLPEVVALTLLLDVPASLLHGGLNLRAVRFAEMRMLLPGILIGALTGLLLTAVTASHWPLLALGLYVTTVAVRKLLPPRSPPPVLHARWGHVAGAAIGLVEMLFGAAGPLVMAWLGRRLSDVQSMRCTAPLVITASALLTLLAMGAAGRLSHADLWLRWGALIGVALVGTLIGHRCAARMRVHVLQRSICVLLVASGLTLVVRSI